LRRFSPGPLRFRVLFCLARRGVIEVSFRQASAIGRYGACLLWRVKVAGDIVKGGVIADASEQQVQERVDGGLMNSSARKVLRRGRAAQGGLGG
jgi:hypothetical protein